MHYMGKGPEPGNEKKVGPNGLFVYPIKARVPFSNCAAIEKVSKVQGQCPCNLFCFYSCSGALLQRYFLAGYDTFADVQAALFYFDKRSSIAQTGGAESGSCRQETPKIIADF